MAKFIFALALVATCLSLSLGGLPKRQGPPRMINRPPPPKPNRYAREANPQGSVSVGVQKPMSGPERRPTINVDYQHKIWEGKNGHVSAGGGAVKYPGERWQPQVGIQGQWRFRREANPQGSVSVGVQKPLSGPERRPTVNVDYQHKIWEGKNGHVSAGGGAVKYPGQRWQPQVGIQGQWRFRREANPQGSVSASVQKPLSGPERRPTYNIDYQHKVFENKHGHFSAGAGGVRYPGQRWEPTVGVQGKWRFRREANPQGSVSVGVQKPLSGPERRPTVNVDYQHKIWEGKNGHVSAGGGAVKYPGQRWQPQVGIQGQWRFRREANPQGSVSASVQKPLSGPERRPTYNIDYQHKVFENKHGHFSAGAGGVRYPGQRWEPTVGVQGRWNF